MLSESMDNILKLGALDVLELTAAPCGDPAARMAAANRTDEHLQRLSGIVDRQRTTTITDPDIPNYDLAFHTTIGQASGNRLLAAFIAAVHGSTHPRAVSRVTKGSPRRRFVST